ncbi:MAG: CHAT domain-containing protein [Cyanobacteria bacterium HKST-UBA02]|nr:CHAT domain-containing protein [Cyanobacteria bacterium HKST-UBA02]
MKVCARGSRSTWFTLIERLEFIALVIVLSAQLLYQTASAAGPAFQDIEKRTERLADDIKKVQSEIQRSDLSDQERLNLQKRVKELSEELNLLIGGNILADYEKSEEKIATELSTGKECMKSGDWRKASDCFRSGIDLCEEYGQLNDSYSELLNLNAIALEKLGDLEGAEVYFTRCPPSYDRLNPFLEIETTDDDRKARINALLLLGMFYIRNGQFHKAEDIYRQYAEDAAKFGGKVNLAIWQNNFATALLRQSKLDESLEIFRYASELATGLGDRGKLINVRIRCHLSELYSKKGNIANAKAVIEPLLASNDQQTKQSAEVALHALDKPSPLPVESTPTEFDRGLEDCRRGEYASAAANFANALRVAGIDQRKRNEINGWMSFTCNMLGNFAERGQVPEALQPDSAAVYISSCDASEFCDYSCFLPKFFSDEKQVESFLSERKKLLPENHPLVGQSYRYLAHICWHKGEQDKSKMYLKKAISIFERSLGANHLMVLETLAQLASVSFGTTSNLQFSCKIRIATSLNLVSALDRLSKARSLLVQSRMWGGWDGQSPDEAIKYCKESLDVLAQSGNFKVFEVLVYNSLAQLYYMVDSHEAARSVLRNSVSIWEGAENTDPVNCAYAYQRLAELCASTKDIEETHHAYEQALKWYTACWGKDSKCVARLHYSIALYSPEKDPEKYKKVEAAVEMVRKACGDDSLEATEALKILSYYEAQKRPAAAAQMLEKVQESKRKAAKTSGKVDPYETSNTIHEQAMLKFQTGDLVGADRAYRKYLEEFRAFSPNNCPQLSFYGRNALDLLSSGHIEVADFKRVGPPEKDLFDFWGNWEFPLAEVLEKRLAEREKNFGSVSRQVVETKLELAILMQFVQPFQKSKFITEAKDSLRLLESKKDSSKDVGVDYLLGALVLAGAGELADARDFANRALSSINIKDQSPESLARNVDLANRIATFFLRCRHLGSARSACDLSIAQCKLLKASGQLSNSYSLSSTVAALQGDISKAAEHALLARQNASSGEMHRALEASLMASESAGMIKESADFAKANVDLYNKEREAGKRINMRDLMFALGNLSRLLVRQGRFDEAEKNLNDMVTLEPSPNTSVEESLQCYSIMDECRAAISLSKGHLMEARDKFVDAVGWPDDASRTLQQKPFDQWIRNVNMIALVDKRDGHPELAADTVLKASSLIDSFVAQTFSQVSFSEQCAFIGALRSEIDGLLSFATDSKTLSSTYGYLVTWKGMLARGLKRHAEAERIAAAQKPALVERIREIEHELVGMQSSDKTGSAIDWSMRHHDLSAELERCQREVAGFQTNEVAPLESPEKITHDIQLALAADQGLIDTFVYCPVGTDTTHYGAIVLRRHSIAFHDLGECKYLDDSIHGLLTAIRARSPMDKGRGLRDVRVLSSSKARSVDWSMLNDRLSVLVPEDVKSLFLCMDGELALVPPVLIINESIRVSEIDDARQIAKDSKQSGPAGGKVLLVGDVDFSGYLPQLPFSKEEVNVVREFATRKSLDVISLSGNRATKSAFRSEMPNCVVAHVATHGFFENQATETATRSAGTLAMTPRQLAEIARNPLLQCGLIFAADTALGGSHRLTAEEIATVNLSNCELVTLSACETGRGRPYSGQGVVGLRTCLTAAGVKHLLISLWSVDDAATSALMQEFYEQMWIHEKPLAEALTLAQKKIRTNDRWSHPFYWAGWILVGE